MALAVKDCKIASLDSIEPLEQALRYVMVLVGIRSTNLPEKAEKAVLINFIQTNYGGHTAAEIRLAFEMAVAGKLDCDPVPYENFSVLYFSTVMNAYRKWAAQEYRESIREVPMKQELLTDEQLEHIHRGDVEAFYQRCRKGIVPHKVPDYFKAILVKDGIMTQDQNLAVVLTEKLGNGVENLYEPKDEEEKG